MNHIIDRIIQQLITRQQFTFHLGILTALLLVSPLSRAQQLLEMYWEELPSQHIILDYSFSDVSMLMVESTIPKLMFGSTRGIKAGAVRDKEPGIWWVTLTPGVQLIDIAAAGYLPLKDIRHNFEKRRVWLLKVTGESPVGVGSVRIETDPPACYVVFNGIRLPEKTPVTLTNQPTGVHRLQLDGGFEWTPLDTAIIIKKDQESKMTFRLTQRSFAHLKITTTPPGARISLNDKSLGVSPIDNNSIIADRYTLKADLVDFYPISQSIETKEGEITRIHLDLLHHKGSLEIATESHVAEVFIDDVSKGKLDKGSILLKDIDTGIRRLTLKKAGYFDLETTAKVQLGKTTNLSLKLQPRPGKLFIESDPPGARVALLGSPAWTKSPWIKSPGEIDSVAVGRYRLMAKLKGYNPQMTEGTLAPGEQEAISISMTPKTRSQAVWRSLLLPGAGQRFAERPVRGWALTCAQIATVAFSYYAYLEYQDKYDQTELARQDYEFSRQQYHDAITPQQFSETRTRMVAALDRWKNTKNDVDQTVFVGTIAYGAAGGIYMFNALDVIFLNGGKIKFDAPVSSR